MRTRAFPPPHPYFQPGGLLAVSDQMIRCLWYRLGLWIFIKAFCSTPQILCVYCSCVPTPECTMVSTSSSCQVQTHSTDFYTVLPSDHLLLICLHIYFPSTQLCLPVRPTAAVCFFLLPLDSCSWRRGASCFRKPTLGEAARCLDTVPSSASSLILFVLILYF